MNEPSGGLSIDVGDGRKFQLSDRFTRSIGKNIYDLPDPPEITPDDLEGVEAMDFGKMLMRGFSNVGSGLGWLAKKTGMDPNGVVENSYNDAVDWWNDSLSEPAKRELAKRFVVRDEDGSLTWGDAGLTSAALQGVGLAPDVLASLTGGAGAVKALKMFANPLGRKALVETLEQGSKAGATVQQINAAKQAQKKLQMVDSAIGIGGFGGFEGTYAGAQNASEVEQMIFGRSHDDLLESERYRDIFNATDDSASMDERIQYAKETLMQEAGNEAFWKSGMATAALGAPAGAFFGKLLSARSLSKIKADRIPAFGPVNETITAAARSRPGALAKGALIEGVTEGVQEATETAITLDVFNRVAAGDEDILAESMNAGVLGALAGAGAGGVFSAAGYKAPSIRDSDPDINSLAFKERRAEISEKLKARLDGADIQTVEQTAQQFDQIRERENGGATRLETIAMYDVLAETGEVPRETRGIDEELNDPNPDLLAQKIQELAGEMTPEQMTHVRTIDPITSVRNLQTLKDQPPAEEYVAFRADSQGFVERNLGPEAANMLAGHIGRALSDINVDVYHAGGGNFVIPVKSVREQRRLKKALDEIEPMTLTNGENDVEIRPVVATTRSQAVEGATPWQGALQQLEAEAAAPPDPAVEAGTGQQIPGVDEAPPASVVVRKPGEDVETKRTTAVRVGANANEDQVAERIEEAAALSATSPENALQPTQAELESGNYQKGRVQFQHGLTISIENPVGSKRRGRDKDSGEEWSRTLKNHYGYIEGTKGNDGDEIDAFLGPAPNNPLRPVFVVNQISPDGKFDEHKVMLGFRTREAAVEAYRQNYPEENPVEGDVAQMGFQEFKRWLKDGDKSAPIGTREKEAEVQDAEAVREDAGQVPEGGTVQEGGAEEGGPDLQRGQEAGRETGRLEGAPAPTEEIDVVPKGRYRFAAGDVSDSGIRFRNLTPITSTTDPEISFRSNKFGETLVSGPTEKIRMALAARGVTFKGRPNAQGDLLFTPNQTPVVRGVLMNETTLQGRAGLVTEHQKDKDGNWVGAPPDYATSGKFVSRRRAARQLLDEGWEGRNWYENSAEQAVKMFGGDRDKARQFLGLLAIYSPNTEVKVNTSAALKAWLQWQNGQEPNAGTGTNDAKALKWLRDGEFDSSQKVTNFYQNLVSFLEGNNPDLGQGATIDLWMMRTFGYKTDAPTTSQYRFAEVEVNKLAEEAGIEPHQVQAAIWVSIKARMNNLGVKRDTESASIKAGDMRKVRNEDGDLERVFKNPEAEERHRRRWFDKAMAHTLTEEDMERAVIDYGSAMISGYLTQISWEAAPGASTGILSGYANATPEQRAEFHEAIDAVFRGPNGENRLAQEMGLPWLKRVRGPGVWKGESDPSSQEVVATPIATGQQQGRVREIDPAAVNALDGYAAIVGRTLKQEGVGWVRPDYASTKARANGVQVDIGRSFTAEEAVALERAVNARVADGTDVVFTATGEGMFVFQLPVFGDAGPVVDENGDIQYNMPNYERAKAKPDFHKAVKAAVLEDLEIEAGFTQFRAASNLIENDWTEDSNGEGYLRQARRSGYGSVAEWADRVLAPEIEAVYEEFAGRYGWGETGTVVEQGGDFRFSIAETGTSGNRPRGPPDELARGGRPEGDQGTPRAKPGEEELTGLNFTQSPRPVLDGRYYGTGYRGDEWARVSSASDTRIKHRVYMYVDNGSGIRPEKGVGDYAKIVTMPNMYDYQADPLGLTIEHNGDINAIESAILDNGYNGYFVRESLDGQATAVTLGDASHAIQTRAVDEIVQTPTVSRDLPSSPARELAGRLRDIEKDLPMGSPPGSRWIERITELDPQLKADLESFGVFESMDPEGNYYLSDIIKKARRLEEEQNRSILREMQDEIPDQMSEPEIGAKLRARWSSDFDGTVGEYETNPESAGGQILNTDVARELSPEYRDDRSRSSEVHEASSDFIKALYAKRLSEPTPEGFESKVVFSAGGTGAGKTTGLKQVLDNDSHPEIIYDTNGNNVPSTRKKIDAALEAGRDVEIVYTHRDPIESFANGVIPRAMRMKAQQGTGRTVPTYIHAETHAQANDAIRELAQIYENDNRVIIRVVDNSKGKGKATEIALTDLPTVPTEEEINEQLLEEVQSALEEGRIGRAEAAGFRVGPDDPGTTGRSDDQGGDQEPEQARPQRDPDHLNQIADYYRNSVAAITTLQEEKNFPKADREAMDAAQNEADLLATGWSHAKTKDGEIVLLPIAEQQAQGYGSQPTRIREWLDGTEFASMDIKVHADHRSAPVSLQRAMGFDATGANNQSLPVEAAYDTWTGEVHVFSNMVISEAELHRILTEEIVGHAGLRAVFGEKLDQFLDTAEIPTARLMPIARTYRLNLNDAADLRVAREEYVAKLTPESGTIWNQLMDWMRQALRDLGIKLELTDAEGQTLLHRAREAVLKGTAPTARFSAEVRSSAGDMTQNRAFREWFGDSVLKDRAGNPLTVYHGTTGQFYSFDRNKIGRRDEGFYGTGFYFTPNELTAESYARDEDSGEEGSVVPVHLKLENPFIWDAEYRGAKRRTAAALEEFGINRDPETLTGLDSDSLANSDERRKFTRAVKSAGHDGVIVKSRRGVEEIIVFEPEQIKSATENVGTFDPANPDIRFSVADQWRFSAATIAPSGNSRVNEILDRVLAKSDYDKSPGERLFDLKGKANRLFDNWQLKAKQGMIDSGASLEAIEKELNGALGEGANSAWKAYHLTHNLNNVMSAVIKYGVPIRDAQGWFTIDPNGKGLSEIFSPLVKNGSNLMRLWEGYAAARRARQLLDETNPDGSPRERLMAEDEIQTLLALGEEFPVLEQVFDEYQAFNRKLLDLATDVGLLNEETRDMWAENDYVPFYRVFEEDVEGPAGMNTGGSRAEVRSTGIKRLTGSERQLQPILENIVMNTANLIDKTYKHEAMKRIRDLGVEAGAMEQLPQAWKPVKMTNGMIADTLRKAGMLTGRVAQVMDETGLEAKEAYDALVADMTGQERDRFQTMFEMTVPQGKDVVGVMEDGRVRYYRVSDPMLLRTIKGMGAENFGHFVRMMRGFRSTLTSMVTLDPGFMMANWMRDTLSAWVTSSDVEFTPLTDAVKSFGDIWTGKRDSTYAKVLMAGGSGGGFYDVHPGDLTRTMEDQMGTTVLNSPSKILNAYRRIGNVSEQSNRIAIGAAVLKSGGSVAEAAFQAQDVTNFTSHGDWVAMRLLTQTVPFMNARIQGLYKLYRGGRDNPTKFMLRGMGVVAATALLLAKNWDDERYESLPDWQKDIYWHIFIGDQHFAIPKPFEAGVIFGAMPERLLRLAGGKDELQDTGRFLTTTIGETLAMNPIPQAFKPLIEQWANKSFFMGRDIVPFYQTGLQPEAQYRHYTSDTARLVADLMPDFAPEFLRSPARLEHLVRGYLGTMGHYMMTAADGVSNKVAGYAPQPETSILDFPAVKRFVRGSGPQPTRYESMLWDSLKEVDAAYSTMNAYLRQGRQDAARELREEKADLLANRDALQDVANTVRDLNDVEKQIMFSLMDPAEKRRRLDDIQKRKNELLKRTVPDLYLKVR